MTFKDWADLKVLYKQSRKQPNKQLFRLENARKLWPMWAAAATTLPLLVFAGFGIKYPMVVPMSYVALALWAGGLFFTRLKAFQTVYPAQFDAHAIDRQSWAEQENILCYAFFLQIIRNEGYTTDKLRKLSAYSDLTVAPAKPALSQNLGFVSLFGLMIALSTEVIKATSFFLWGKGAVALMLVAVVLFIYWLVWDGIQSAAYERLRIKRYVELAVHDLDDVVQDVLQVNPAPDSMDSLPLLAISNQN